MSQMVRRFMAHHVAVSLSALHVNGHHDYAQALSWLWKTIFKGALYGFGVFPFLSCVGLCACKWSAKAKIPHRRGCFTPTNSPPV